MKVDKYKNRKYILIGIISFTVVIFIVRLFYLQIINENYKKFADNNAFLKNTVFPSRGLIFDRNGKLVVYNQPSYDVMIVMKELENFDTLEFCRIVHIDKEDFLERIKRIKNKRLNPSYSSYTPQLLLAQISLEEHGVLQEKLFKMPGIYIQSRTMREYAYPNASHILGFVGEASKTVVDNDPYYQPGNYIGINGIESQYEKQLRGQKGCEILLRNSHGKIIGKYDDGNLDTPAKKGKDIQLSIDIDLQAFGEKLMQQKIGSIVAIEPSTGEILAAVSAPYFSPSLLVGRKRTANFDLLNSDKNKPLLNRPFMGRYAPGSTFKTLNALIFEQEGIITPNTYYPCQRGYRVGRFSLGCHSHASPLNLTASIQHSCNAYYCYAFRAMLDNPKYGNIGEAFEVWKDYAVSFGFGYALGVDIPSENRGFIPNKKVYDKVYGENRWKSLQIVSLAIGQGEIVVTPAQIANLAATIANKGYWFTPHFVKKIEDSDNVSFEKHETKIESKFFEPVIEGMNLAVNSEFGGTARIARIHDITVCGKTGTAENSHGEDHSIFMAFAPKESPKIAIAVLVENAGFGATWAAPIGSLMIEKYLKGDISPERLWLENYVLKANLMPYAKKN